MPVYSLIHLVLCTAIYGVCLINNTWRLAEYRVTSVLHQSGAPDQNRLMLADVKIQCRVSSFTFFFACYLT
jgi:hypothetical protein